ncbi:MAG TPA: glycosyltransferase [Acidimicrobiales bacterium]|nr:glycosyltransferase [Acidimicrobiales bacterium]
MAAPQAPRPFPLWRVGLVVGLGTVAICAVLVAAFGVTARPFYFLYIATSIALSLVCWTTLVWMLDAWRTPQAVERTGLSATTRTAKYSFSLIVPARHEEKVIAETLGRLIATDYPDFEILLVLGHDDTGTQAAAQPVVDAHPDVVRVVIDENWPKNKPKALNTALPYCRGQITGVFDAEDEVHPQLLRRVDECFQRTDADVVQAGVQLMNFHSNWFAVRNVLEYYFWFRSRLHFQARAGFIPLGGNTVFARTDLLREVGGWDPECLAEDCELGVRLSSMHKKFAVFYEPELVTQEETPPTLGAFLRQRTRWNQGYLQTLSKGYWRTLPRRERLLGLYTLLMPCLLALGWVLIPVAIATAVAVKAPVVATLASFLPAVPMLAVLAVEMAALGEFCRSFGFRSRARDYVRLAVGLPFYHAVLAFSAARSVGREARGTRGWEKTAHFGLHFVNEPAGPVPLVAAPGVPVGPAAVGRDGGDEAERTGDDGQEHCDALDAAAVPAAPLAVARPRQPVLIAARQAGEARSTGGSTFDVDAPLATAHALQEGGAEARPAEHRPDEHRPDGHRPDRHRPDGKRPDDRRPDGPRPEPWRAKRAPQLPPWMPEPWRPVPVWTSAAEWLGALPEPLPAPLPVADVGDAPTGRRPGWARRLVRSHPDGVVQVVLLAAVAVVQAMGMFHWPVPFFDEGTYVANAWAVQTHGVLSNYTYGYGHPPLAWLLLAGWTWSRHLLGHALYSIDTGRELMFVVTMVSCSLLYTVARRLGMRRAFAAGAVVLFALSPTALYFHRLVLLDNFAVAWALAAIALALSPRRGLWTFAASGACLAGAVLSKETAIVLVPVVFLAAATNLDPRTRRYCATLLVSLFALLAVAYPLYAILKGELIPGKGHVSLFGEMWTQLVTRKTSGSVFDPHSPAHAVVQYWLHLDPWLLLGALVLAPVALCRRQLRWVAIAYLGQVALLFRPGYLPFMYVIAMLPFAALVIAGVAQWGWEARTSWGAALSRAAAKLPRLGAPASRVAARPLAVAVVIATLAVTSGWVRGDRTATTTQPDAPERAAGAWVLRHVDKSQHLIVDSNFWIYLTQHGFNADRVSGGFYSRTVVFNWPLDYDPAVQKVFPDGWRDFDYVISTDGIRANTTQTPNTAQALDHSFVVASFGAGIDRVEVREIAKTLPKTGG